MPVQMAQADTTPIQQSAGFDPALCLPIPFITQLPYKNLCWAACCAMVGKALRAYDPGNYGNAPRTLPGMVGKFNNDANCNDGTDPGSIPVGYDTCCDVIAAHEGCGLPSPKCYPGVYGMNDLNKEILGARRALEIEFVWTANNNEGHVALLAGVDVQGGDVWVLDPLFDHFGWTKYDSVVNAYNMGGSWQYSYYSIGEAIGP